VEEDVTANAVVNQLWVSLFCRAVENTVPETTSLILMLSDDLTSSTIPDVEISPKLGGEIMSFILKRSVLIGQL
jgi:hypothetical protein